MNNSIASSDAPAARHPRPRAPTRPVALPRTRPEVHELRDLLEANLHALRALHEEHQRMIQTGLRAIEGRCGELRGELRAIANIKAPWVHAMSETRALLFVALRELIVGEHEAGVSIGMPQQADDLSRTR